MTTRIRLTWMLGAACLTTACSSILDIPERAFDPHLVCNGEECQCAKGFADCDNNDENGCEADLNADSNNCNVCGRECGGTACNNGICEPTVVTDTKDVQSMVLVDGDIYFLTLYGLYKVSAEGGSPELLTPVPTDLGLWVVEGQGVIDWCSYVDVFTSPLGGPATPTVVASNLNFIPFKIAAGAGKIYWEVYDTVTETRTFYRGREEGGGTPEVIKAAVDPAHGNLVSNQTHTYWTENGNVVAIGHNDLAPTTIPVGFYAIEISVDENSFYLWDGTDFYKVPIGGGTPLKLLSMNYPGEVITDATHAYFADPPRGKLVKVRLEGGPAVELASDQTFWYSQLAADDEHIYWATDTAIVRVHK